jgi:hypothetical protein
MKLRTISIAIALLSPLGLLACGSAVGDALSTARQALECQTNSDCGSGAECAVEDNGSFCKQHDQSTDDTAPAADTTNSCTSDADCGAGLECELEHGSSYCKPHGGDDDGSAGQAGSDDGSAGSGGSDDGSATPSSCASDADCGAGLECELEHGTSYCKPHGGNVGGDDAGAGGAGGSDDGSAGSAANPGGACASDADCGAGLECELEHGTSYCKAHGGGGDNSGKGRD